VRTNFEWALRVSSLVCAIACGAPAVEANSDVTTRAGTWFTQNGAVIIDYRGKSDVTLDGAPAPGAAAIPNNDLTLGNGYGYYLTDDISVQLVLGRGPTTNVTDGAGTKLGEMWYGAPSLVLDYNFTQFGALQPFVGAGVSYIWVIDEEDAFIQNLKIDSAFGLILRAGAQVMLDERFGVFSAANKIFADTDARGVVDGAAFGRPGELLPIEAELDLDPWIYQAGFTYRY
jgi:outer membrane protein